MLFSSLNICSATLALLMAPIVTVAQKIVKPNIQYVTLTDTVLLKELDNLIAEEKTLDPLFGRGKGYINLSFSFKRRQGDQLDNSNRTDTVFSYVLNTSFMSPDKNENTLGDMYPPFYSLYKQRLICIYGPDDGAIYEYFGFSKKSKERFRNKLSKYLEPPGSTSRKHVNLTRQAKIYYLRDLLSNTMTPVVVKIKR
jgi:hypothetical protein